VGEKDHGLIYEFPESTVYVSTRAQTDVAKLKAASWQDTNKAFVGSCVNCEVVDTCPFRSFTCPIPSRWKSV